MGNVPKLRFSQFRGEWEVQKIKELLIDFRLGGNYSNNETVNGFPLIKMGNISRGKIILNKIEYINKNEPINKLDKIVYGDLFFNTRNTLDLVGKVAIWKNELKEAYYNSNLMWMKYENNFFMNYRLNSFNGLKSLRRIATGTTSVAAIYTKDLLKINLFIPKKQEQEKIASFLSSVDKKIEKLEEKLALQEKYKKAMMQKLFSQKIRFKTDDGSDFPAWEEKKLGEIAVKKSKKNKENLVTNVLTNSAEFGIVNQQDYFDKDIANQNNLEGYYIVDNDDFIYNPRISSFAPVGPMKRNHIGLGVMSPLYTVLTLNEGNKDFYELYFANSFWHRYMNQIANFGARHDRMNITINELMKMPLPYPSTQEQQKIANFLSSLDKKIEATKKQKQKAQEFKKGLLQQMFV